MERRSLTAKGQETRERILLEGRKLLVAYGNGGLTMREVAKRCAIKLGNLQYYFASREVLLEAIISNEAEQDVATIRGVFASNKSSRAKLQAIIDGLLQRWRGESAVVFSTLNLYSLHDANFKALYTRIYAAHYKALEEAIAHVSPDASRKECARRARLMSALIDGAAYQTDVGRHASFMTDVASHAYSIALGDNPAINR
ncbi:MAG: TetR family transcriptional regulator [Pseudomonadales bacterium]